MTDPKYPIGPCAKPAASDQESRRAAMAAIASAPGLFKSAVSGLGDAQLDTPYRDGGWTVRQVVHHVADSHMNAYIRFRWTLTEDEPVIKTYDEKRWADLPDARTAPIESSLELLEALHARWMALLLALTPADYAKRLAHPELGAVDLNTMLALYAWHGRHHAAHITTLRERNGW